MCGSRLVRGVPGQLTNVNGHSPAHLPCLNGQHPHSQHQHSQHLSILSFCFRRALSVAARIQLKQQLRKFRELQSLCANAGGVKWRAQVIHRLIDPLRKRSTARPADDSSIESEG